MASPWKLPLCIFLAFPLSIIIMIISGILIPETVKNLHAIINTMALLCVVAGLAVIPIKYNDTSGRIQMDPLYSKFGYTVIAVTLYTVARFSSALYSRSKWATPFRYGIFLCCVILMMDFLREAIDLLREEVERLIDEAAAAEEEEEEEEEEQRLLVREVFW